MNPTDSKSTSAVLVAAGRSLRMGGGSERKPFIDLAGRTVLEHVCAAFDQASSVAEIVIVGCAEDLDRIRKLAASSRSMGKVRRVVAGGEARSDSVAAGVEAADRSLALLAIHDVARPLVTPDLVERAIAVAALRGAAVVAVPVTDTIKISSDGERAESTLDRGVLWSAQTPQVFRADLFRELLDRARKDGYRPTDDAALHETYVGPVPIVQGDPSNWKLTWPGELALAAAVLRERETRSDTPQGT
jgi:2-C-methyl-D-erythritol 4-phosphate cytidylyltransferase